MAGTVLGKRSRASQDASELQSSPATRSSKRSKQFVIAHDEDENPFVGRRKQASRRHGDHMELDELALEENSTPQEKAKTTRSVPAKHRAPERRIPLSPKKIDTIFKLSKPASTSEEIFSKPGIPQTPRHRDTPAKKVAITPRHRVGLIGKPSTPVTPRTPSTPRTTVPTVYNEARQALARTHVGRIVGREDESKELHDFITKRVNAVSSGCLYISGPPGTGKSALMQEIRQEFEENDTVKSVYINCMSVKSAKDIYEKLLESFSNDLDDIEDCNMDSLKDIFQEREVSYLVTLDEIDHMLDLDMELLYKLFSWALQRKSSLILIGIANALDFTDRFLPRLKSRGLKPNLLPFMPYSAPQTASVITSKLKALLPTTTTTLPDFVPFIHPAAIQLLSKKVAAQNGDLRKAFDLCRRAIDLIENETKIIQQKKASELTPDPSPTKTPLMENMNLSSPSSARTPSKTARQNAFASSLAGLTIETAPRATIAHMARITSSIFNNGTTSRLQSLNLQQKAVICALSALERKKRAAVPTKVPATPFKNNNAAPTVKQLYESYSNLCTRENLLHPLTNTEFKDIIGGLETLSLVSAIEGKNGTFAVPATPGRRGRGAGGFGQGLVEDRRVASCFGEKELKTALQGVESGILLAMLEGGGIL